MYRFHKAVSAALLLSLTLAGCGDAEENFDPRSQIGPNPVLPKPQEYLIPPISVAEVIRWKPNEKPVVPAGFEISSVSRNLHRPRQPYVLPNGDILVVESRGPGLAPVTRPKNPLVSWFQTRSALPHGVIDKRLSNRITLLRDANGDGKPEVETVLLDGLFSPFGVIFADDQLYVANTDAIMRFPYTLGQTKITDKGTVLTPLPGGPIDHHWTKSLTISPDGKLLYVGVGSNSNVAEHGMEAEKGRAAIWEVERASGRWREFATGLRNPNGLTFYPGSNILWTVVNERDELGSNLVPDYMTSVRDGGFYGWPYSYYGRHLDPRVMPQRPDLVAKAIVPDYALGSHVAALGLAFYNGTAFPTAYSGGAFVGEHGSWNREQPSGYKVVFIPFANGRPNGMAQDFVTGFLSKQGKTHGRPVGVAIDRTGALLVADDVGGVLWRVTRTPR